MIEAPPVTGSTVRRVGAMVLRYYYLLRSSWPRVLELMYWPTVQMIIWGLVTLHLLSSSEWVAQAAGVLIAAVLLWDVLFRGQLGMSISFLEEMWSRNLGHLFVSPLRPSEWIVSLMTMSLMRTLIGIVSAAFLAIPLYAFNVFDLGLPLIGFFFLLIMNGWWLALIVIAAILRYGLGAETLAWALVFLLAPVSAIYYPVDVLPGFAQVIAYALPAAHVFEGMRQLMFGGGFSYGHFAAGLGLNLVYFGLASLLFLAAFRNARATGALLQQGE